MVEQQLDASSSSHRSQPVDEGQQQQQQPQQTILPRGSDSSRVTGVDRPPQLPRRRRISFGHVKIIEFPYGISSSSVCNSGPPIALADVLQDDIIDHRHDENIHQQQKVLLPHSEHTSDIHNKKREAMLAATATTTTIEIEEYESYRPQQRRSKSDLHLSADRRRALLLENGWEMGEISEATKDANRIRKQRAETIREIRLSISTNAADAAASTAAAAAATTQMNITTSSSPKSSTRPHSSNSNGGKNREDFKDEEVVSDDDGIQAPPVPPACPSPVATSPIRRSRKRWNGRRGGFRGPARDSLSPTPRQSGRRLSSAMLVDTLSPPSESFRRLSCLSPQNNNGSGRDTTMTMKKKNNGGPKLCPRFSLSPPRPLRNRTEQQPTASVPMPRLTPKRKRAPSITQLSPSSNNQNNMNKNFNWSASLTKLGDGRSSGYGMVDENSSTFLSPPKRRRTPTKVDPRPLVMPSRTYSPPPSPLVSSRNFQHR